METSSEPRAIQILTFSKDDVHLNAEALRGVLAQERLKSLPLVIVSIAGALRTGKSFLLNFFLRYLRGKGWKNKDWLEGFGSTTESGFHWQGGVKPDTKGIFVWNEIFIVESDHGSKNKIAVILMDTQGLFDPGADRNVNAKILAISLFLSSVQIFNVCEQIQDDNLEFLRFFTEYARGSSNENVISFQKLIFVVRDWKNEVDYDCGAEGGKKYFHEHFGTKIKSSTSTYMKELKNLFKNIDCFLLPNPMICKPRDFTGALNEIEEDFLKNVGDLASSIFHPDNLSLKTIGGEISSPRFLLNHVTTIYAEAFKSRRLPGASTMAKAYVMSSCWEHYLRALDRYDEIMDQKSVQFVDGSVLQSCHKSAKSNVMSRFQKECPFIHREEGLQFQKRLNDALEIVSFPKYQGLNKLENINRTMMELLGRVQETRKRLENSEKNLHKKKDEIDKGVAEFISAIHDFIEKLADYEVEVYPDSGEKCKFVDSEKLLTKCRNSQEKILLAFIGDKDKLEKSIDVAVEEIRQDNENILGFANKKEELNMQQRINEFQKATGQVLQDPSVTAEKLSILIEKGLQEHDLSENKEFCSCIKEDAQKKMSFLDKHNDTIVNSLGVAGAVVGFCGLMPIAGPAVVAGALIFLGGALACKIFKNSQKSKSNKSENQQLIKNEEDDQDIADDEQRQL